MCRVLIMVYVVLSDMCCVCCNAYWGYYIVLRFVYCVLCVVYVVVCMVYCVLCVVYYVLCIVYWVFCIIQCVVCIINSAWCIVMLVGMQRMPKFKLGVCVDMCGCVLATIIAHQGTHICPILGIKCEWVGWVVQNTNHIKGRRPSTDPKNAVTYIVDTLWLPYCCLHVVADSLLSMLKLPSRMSTFEMPTHDRLAYVMPAFCCRYIDADSWVYVVAASDMPICGAGM